ncbi:MAG: alpha-amylase family glycosyl hydrolase [Terracidiphilus sp.]
MSSQMQSLAPVHEHIVKRTGADKKDAELCPSLYQINTRVLMQELGRNLGRAATLDDIPEDYLNRLAQQNFDWVWFLGIWQTGQAGRKVSRQNRQWLREYGEILPDFTQDDICGSCFSITRYEANVDFGGNAALDRLRDRIHARGMKLLLDFVPNHTALDHEWVIQHPEFYVRGTEEKLRSEPQNYILLGDGDSSAVFAYGRDPYFDGWPDTVQLNYAEPTLQHAMIGELQKIAQHCDGVRCDMAMLILPDVFERTWGLRPDSFWPRAIEAVRAFDPGFLFIAEVYWDLEWTLQQQGFSYTYDKRLYDRLHAGQARPVRDHFRAAMDFQMKSARFLENHDEPRAAAVFAPEQHRAAAVLTFLCPGLRFFHDGQFEGRKKKVPVHLGRRPDEPTDPSLVEFYEHLLACVNLPAVRTGSWSLLECTPAWEGNWTWDCCIGFAWHGLSNERLVVVVNYAPNQSQCYVHVPFADLNGRSVLLEDLLGHHTYERDTPEMSNRGLFLDLGGWGYHVFRVTPANQ